MLTSPAGIDPAGGFSAFDLESRKTIVAAVSGGGDSLALLILLQAFLRARAPSTRLVAATVDHRLRADSAAEAGKVATLCSARGIEHAILPWEGEKPRTGLSAAAREARYRLLAETAERCGSDLVLTGHNEDDQAETVAMRGRRGSGRGLAGMAPATLFEGRVWIGRPLLGAGREALRDVLRREGLAWIEDPTNDDACYERVRARRQLAAAAAGLRQKLLDETEAAAALRIALGKDAAALIRAAGDKVAPGLIRLDRTALAAASHPAAAHALRLLLAACGGREHLADEGRAAVLLDRVLATAHRGALSGTLVDSRRSGIFLHREWRGGGPAAIPAVDGALWDGRFRILMNPQPAGDRDFAVAPMGKVVAAKIPVPEDVAADLARAALAAQPMVREAKMASSEPGGSELDPALVPVVAPYARFLPSFDLAPANALANLLGATPFPAPPFACRNQGDSLTGMRQSAEGRRAWQ